MPAQRHTKLLITIVQGVAASALLFIVFGTDPFGIGVPADVTLGFLLGALAVSVVASWLGVVAHELGHAFAAYYLGLKVRVVSAGPIAVDFTGDSPRITRGRGTHGADAHVFWTAGELPPALWLRASKLATLAGPVAGVLWSLLALALSALVHALPWLHSGLVLSAWLGIALSVINLIPLRIGMLTSDGLKLLWLLTGNEQAARLETLGRWGDTLFSEVSPGNWPEEMIREQEQALAPRPITSVEELSVALAAGQMLYLHYADRHDWPEAHHVIAAAADLPRKGAGGKAGSLFDGVDVYYAVHLALRGSNGLGARAALDRVSPRSPVQSNSLVAGAQAAIALAELDPEAARENARLALERLRLSDRSPGCDRVEATWWDDVLERAEQLDAALQQGRRPVIAMVAPAAAAPRSDFAWDPGVAPEQRALWLWRAPAAGGLDLVHTRR